MTTGGDDLARDLRELTTVCAGDTLVACEEVTALRRLDDTKVWPSPGDRFQVLSVEERAPGLWKVTLQTPEGVGHTLHHEGLDAPWLPQHNYFRVERRDG